ncbi:MAG: hypothetical protein IT548_15770 [Alphaproteobacteria bacterium]|nr:hypothetical protein [Alphaproteobacteria bacterium]
MLHWVLVAASLAAPAEAVPEDSPLKPVCDLVCGTWEPEAIDDEHNADSFRLELHWDAASGELRGTQTAFGGQNGTMTHDLAFRANHERDITLVVSGAGMRTESLVRLGEGVLQIDSLAPGNPTITASTTWTLQQDGRLRVERAESAAHYNYGFGEQYYRRAK